MKYIVTLNGKQYEVEVEQTEAVITKVTDAPVAAAPAPVTTAPAAAAAPTAPAAIPAAADGTQVLSPMPGTILSVDAPAGTVVKAGDLLMILEAMKMENEIVAPKDGTVKQVLVQKGATVNTDDVLVVIG